MSLYTFVVSKCMKWFSFQILLRCDWNSHDAALIVITSVLFNTKTESLLKKLLLSNLNFGLFYCQYRWGRSSFPTASINGSRMMGELVTLYNEWMRHYDSIVLEKWCIFHVFYEKYSISLFSSL